MSSSFKKSLYPSYLIYQHPVGRAMEMLIGHRLSDRVQIAQLGSLHSVGPTWEWEGVGIEKQAGKGAFGGRAWRPPRRPGREKHCLSPHKSGEGGKELSPKGKQEAREVGKWGR